eukprot:CAMPEP_0184700548 /NCGR_PEP_ID=MMETSP0313-20130426/14252_1 /TAXON_ID=2792 /ORGANISM="Porphyridium aerugineum, Strain SAG 1380-2" /LENGTH=38 /DNA_ID= /DNA_START= /DNA_END= /DNA_ORIENTATION=
MKSPKYLASIACLPRASYLTNALMERRTAALGSLSSSK